MLPASVHAEDAEVEVDAAAAPMPPAAPLADIVVDIGCSARPNWSCAMQAAGSAATGWRSCATPSSCCSCGRAEMTGTSDILRYGARAGCAVYTAVQVL